MAICHLKLLTDMIINFFFWWERKGSGGTKIKCDDSRNKNLKNLSVRNLNKMT